MKAHTQHGSVTKTAIGYVRVSSQEQAAEGVSLDAQRDRLRSYCKLSGILLIEFISDEGISPWAPDPHQRTYRKVQPGRCRENLGCVPRVTLTAGALFADALPSPLQMARRPHRPGAARAQSL
jgi:hypothetical protein